MPEPITEIGRDAKVPAMTNPVSRDTAAASPGLYTQSVPVGGWANPRGGFLFFLGFAAIGTAMALLVPAVLTISLKATIIDPANAGTIVSIAVAVGALFSLVALPLFGRISDRITSRSGRRRPLLVLGAVLIAIGAVITFASSTTAVLTVGSVFTQVGFAAATVAVTSVIPDQFEPAKRGPASSIVGVSLPVGAVIGLFIAQLFSPTLSLMILVPAAVGVVGILLFAVVLHDQPFPRDRRPAFTAVSFFSTFWVNPAKSPAFAWAWWSRCLLFFGVAAVQAYQALYLIFVLHFSPQDVAGAVFLSTLVLTIAALIFAAIAGKVSDRIGRRKPFVMASSILFAIGLLIAANANSFPGFLLAIGIVGVGQGIYFAVDLALVTQVLPDPDNPAKDMGVIALANTLPSSIVPAIAPAILAIGATAALTENYAALFIAGAIAAVIGAVLVLPIRGVK
ncbi:hypothetical protein B7R54_02525 [Subtercola boreus]|uniref:Major facilitator superfamily (MFS) profile domain-containing protein n=2 Tax=Subtercola boreus TaxID=120213 RepID=A0A3E0VEQ5_9MICO|nr:hypothetical protein B7R54_02525 [Subtercola boreus]